MSATAETLTGISKASTSTAVGARPLPATSTTTSSTSSSSSSLEPASFRGAHEEVVTLHIAPGGAPAPNIIEVEEPDSSRRVLKNLDKPGELLIFSNGQPLFPKDFDFSISSLSTAISDPFDEFRGDAASLCPGEPAHR